MQELDSIAEFDAAHDAEFFVRVPARPALFSVEPREELAGAKPYLLRTANLRERLKRLLGLPESGSKRLNLREFAARVRYRVLGSSFELSFLHWQHARRLWPAEYRERVRLRPPAVLKLSPCERLSALLCHAPHRRERRLFRAVRLAPRGG